MACGVLPYIGTMRLSAVLFGLSAVFLALSPLACAGESTQDGGDPTAAEQGSSEDELKSLQLTDADDGKTVTVTKGQNILVKLSANPSTGYQWVVAATNRTFGYPASDRFVATSGGAVGSGGIQRFMWKTSSALDILGTHSVRLEYKRPWENNVAPAKTFSFTVNIVDPAAPSCPQLSPPAPDFCKSGQQVQARQNEDGCTTGYDCVGEK